METNKLSLTRRDFLKITGAGSAALLTSNINCTKRAEIPSYLKGYEEIYSRAPRKAALEWFRNAKFGLFIHYGLYSLLGRHEWVLFDEAIPIAEYDKLKDRFTAEKFDVDFITDLTLEAEMKYINLVTRHCDSFALWDTKYSDFDSVNSPAKRDLVAELSEACRKKGLGFFAFYEHGFDWRHPHGPSPWDWSSSAVRPHYDPPEPFYAYGEDYDFQKYLDYAAGQITELLTNFGPLAGIWLDGAGIPHSGDKSKFRLPELYDLIHRLQPQTLISYKWGVTGTEDFLGPEEPQLERINKESQDHKPMEVCTSLHDGGSTRHKIGWGYVKDSKHLTADEVMKKLEFTESINANLLLNTGPLPDGSIHPEDVAALREVGRRLRAKS